MPLKSRVYGPFQGKKGHNLPSKNESRDRFSKIPIKLYEITGEFSGAVENGFRFGRVTTFQLCFGLFLLIRVENGFRFGRVTTWRPIAVSLIT